METIRMAKTSKMQHYVFFVHLEELTVVILQTGSFFRQMRIIDTS